MVGLLVVLAVFWIFNTGRVYFDVVLCSTCVSDAIRRVIGGWVTSTVVTCISVFC